MPRISERLYAERRRHVQVCAWRCFARQGFHATSMDDVIAETGMSSSAVYRYIRGKDELIAAAADEALALLGGHLADLLTREPVPTPAETLSSLLDSMHERMADPAFDLTKIAVQAWGEALRSPEIGARTSAVYRTAQDRLTRLAHRWVRAGLLPADADPAAVGVVLLTLIPGLIVGHHLVTPQTAEQLVSGLAALGRAL